MSDAVLNVGVSLSAKVVAQTSVSLVFPNRGFLRNRRIPVGATYATGIALQAGVTGNSNDRYLVGVFPTRVLHHLADPADEEAYKGGAMLSDLEVLMEPSFYLDHAQALETFAAPELEEPERHGNVIEYRIIAQVVLLP